MASISATFPCFLTIALLFLGLSTSDLDQDKAECADKLVSLATCLPYASGEAKAPTLDCCTGLISVINKNKKCLCLLLKYRDDPNLGFKLNATLALALPSACHVDGNIPECVDLLHLPKNSSEAMFYEGTSSNSTGKGNSSSTTGSASAVSPATVKAPSSEDKNGGGRRRRRWVEMETIFGLLICVFTFSHLRYVL